MRLLATVGLCLALAACGTRAAGPTPLATGNPSASSFAYSLFTHCGVLSIQVARTTYYVAAIDPSTVTAGLSNPFDPGVMTVVSKGKLRFSDSTGHTISFVDQPPGAVGVAYPFQVHVQSGGDTIRDAAFAGRLWHPAGTLPGVHGPPYGNGQDRFTDVDGTMTLQQSAAAVFRSANGQSVTFIQIPEPVGCD